MTTSSPLSLKELYNAGHLDQLEQCLKDTMDWPQNDMDETLKLCLSDNRTALANTLMDHGAVLTLSSFRIVCARRNISNFQMLLDHGWDINSTDHGDLALRMMVGNEENVRWFLEHGADPNKPGKNGFTPLSTTASVGTVATMQLLVTYGAHFDTLDDKEVFHKIMRRPEGEGLPILKYLLENGFDPNAPGKTGRPLHIAARLGAPKNIALTRCLLDYGADRTVRTITGQTPADIAREKGYNEVLDLLLNYGKVE